jgi:copper chaperone
MIKILILRRCNSLHNVKLIVDGMSCGHCVASVEGAISKLGAIAMVDLASKQVEITFDPDQTTVDRLRVAIEDLGFDVVK